MTKFKPNLIVIKFFYVSANDEKTLKTPFYGQSLEFAFFDSQNLKSVNKMSQLPAIRNGKKQSFQSLSHVPLFGNSFKLLGEPTIIIMTCQSTKIQTHVQCINIRNVGQNSQL